MTNPGGNKNGSDGCGSLCAIVTEKLAVSIFGA